MQRLVAGNWKMHGLLADARVRAEALTEWSTRNGARDLQIVLFPPMPQLHALRALLPSTFGVGVQDVHEAAQGAFTGSVAAEMAADVGAQWALVGHSERRRGLGESSALVAAKFAAAVRAGLTPVLCVGEDELERDAGRAIAVVQAQLDAVFELMGAAAMTDALVAYEPVWAIGTGRNARPEQIAEMHAAIAAHVRMRGAGDGGGEARVIYGGSVNAANAASVFATAGVAGALVGGASLSPADFIAICESAQAAG